MVQKKFSNCWNLSKGDSLKINGTTYVIQKVETLPGTCDYCDADDEKTFYLNDGFVFRCTETGAVFFRVKTSQKKSEVKEGIPIDSVELSD